MGESKCVMWWVPILRGGGLPSRVICGVWTRAGTVTRGLSRVLGEAELFRVFQRDYKDCALFDSVTLDLACGSERNDHVEVIGQALTGLP
jgi:hypothetical protein